VGCSIFSADLLFPGSTQPALSNAEWATRVLVSAPCHVLRGLAETNLSGRSPPGFKFRTALSAFPRFSLSALSKVLDPIEQLARPDRGGKLALFFSQRGYLGWSIARNMPTVLLHLPMILEATPRNRQKNFCLLRCWTSEPCPARHSGYTALR